MKKEKFVSLSTSESNYAIDSFKLVFRCVLLEFALQVSALLRL